MMQAQRQETLVLMARRDLLEIHGNTRGQDIKQLACREGCCWIVVVGKLRTGSASCRRVPFASLPATLSNRCSPPIPWSLVLQGWPASVPGDKGSPNPEEAQNQKRSLARPLKCLPPSPSSSGQRWECTCPKDNTMAGSVSPCRLNSKRAWRNGVTRASNPVVRSFSLVVFLMAWRSQAAWTTMRTAEHGHCAGIDDGGSRSLNEQSPLP
jgi:hypothetical protein